jgi:hypothetical protein
MRTVGLAVTGLAAAPAKTAAAVGGDRDARQDSGATVAVNKYYPVNRPPLQRTALCPSALRCRPGGWPRRPRLRLTA